MYGGQPFKDESPTVEVAGIAADDVDYVAECRTWSM